MAILDMDLDGNTGDRVLRKAKTAFENTDRSLSDNLVAGRVFANLESNLSDDATVLNVGCGEGGAGVSEFSPEFAANNVVGSDIRTTGFTSLLADAQALPYEDESADAIVCQAVLEHVEDADAAIDELKRVLKPGGYLFVDVPFIQGYHSLPHDYRRFTLPGLENELAGLEKIKSGVSVGPTTALLWVTTEYLSYVFSFGDVDLKNHLAYGLQNALFWLKYVDRYVLEHNDCDESLLRIPSGIYWYGTKPADASGRRTD